MDAFNQFPQLKFNPTHLTHSQNQNDTLNQFNFIVKISTSINNNEFPRRKNPIHHTRKHITNETSHFANLHGVS